MVVVDSIERWVKEDASWCADNRDVLSQVFEYFLTNGEWPSIKSMRRALHKQGVNIDVQVIADRKPTLPMWSHVASQNQISLGFRHLLGVPKAARLLDLVVEATKLAVSAYSGPEDSPTVQYDNARLHRFTSEELILLPGFLQSDFPNALGGGSLGETWAMYVNEELVLDLSEVSSPQSYVDAQIKIIRRWVEQTSPTPDTVSTEIRPNGRYGSSWAEQLIKADGPISSDQIFIVHGHDVETLGEVAREVTKLTGKEAIVLHQQPNKGQTIIEKFERHAHEAGFVVVLATADDLGHAKTVTDPKPRARQNVVFELGFFVGALGRAKVVIIHDEEVELPSDMAGVIYVPNDGAGDWKVALAKELREAGLTTDVHPSTPEN